MVNKNKRKGSDWEKQAVDLLKELVGGEWKRVPTSGALGSILGESMLMGDIMGKVEFIPMKIRLEAKTGYGGSKQLTIKKEWLDKIREEAEASYSIPGLIIKFSDARSGVKHAIIFDFEAFSKIMEFGNKLWRELENTTH